MAIEHEVQIERPVWLRRVGRSGTAWMILAPILFALVAKVTGLGGSGGMRSWLGYALFAVACAGIVPAVIAYRKGRGAAVARSDERGLTVVRDGAEQKIPVDQIEEAILGNEGRAGRLELRLRGADVLVLRFEKVQDAREALDQLALDDRRRSEQIRVSSRTNKGPERLGAGFLGALVAFIPAMSLVLGLGMGGALFGVVLLIAAARWGVSLAQDLSPFVIVGADGITLSTSYDTTKRFVSYGDVDHFEIVHRDLRKMPKAALVVLVDKSGKRIEIGFFDGPEHKLAESVRAHLTDAVEARKTARESVSHVEELEGRGEPVSDWLARLHKLASRRDGYRADAIDDARIDALVTDGGASKEQRVGAAMLLRIRNQDEGRDRIRVASQACADPDTRAALLAVAEASADEQALERAAHHLR